MTRWMVTLAMICTCCFTGTGHAETNDRIKKLLQLQAINRPPADAAAKNDNASSDASARQGRGSGRGVSEPPSDDRGAAGNVPTRKP
jgi:hypothetical protein